MHYEHQSYKYLFYLFIGFNLLTWIIYLSNPFLVNSGYHVQSLFYVALNVLFLALGYRRGLRKSYRNNTSISHLFLADVKPRTLSFLLLFYLATFLFKYSYELHVPAFNIGALIRRISLGISNPYLGYTTGGSYRPFGWSIYMFICLLDSVFFIIGMLSWRKLSRAYKAIFIILSVIELLKGMGSGSSFGEIKMITTLAVVLVANIKDGSISKKRKRQIAIGVFCAFFAALFIFARNMTGRSGGELSSTFGESLNFNENSFINKYLISHLSEGFQNLYVYICNYLVHGYYNMEYMFSVDYDWTWLFGSNPSKSLFLQVLTGFNVEPLSYQTKIFNTYGIDPYISWHSCYLWLANDVTVAGVPIIMFIIGRFIAVSLILFRQYNDLLSGLICVIFSNMALYLFSNNNYISGVFYPFLFALPYWLITRYFKV